MATVNMEILVSRQDDGVGEGFTHAHEASIGEAHGNVAVLLDKPYDWFQVFSDLESDEQSTAAKKYSQTVGSSRSEKMECFGENRFARRPRRRQCRGLGHGPLVVSVAATEQGHHKPRVNEDVSGHSP